MIWAASALWLDRAWRTARFGRRRRAELWALAWSQLSERCCASILLLPFLGLAGAGKLGCGWLPEPRLARQYPTPPSSPANGGGKLPGVGSSGAWRPEPPPAVARESHKTLLHPPGHPFAGSPLEERAPDYWSPSHPATPASHPARHRECQDPLTWRELRERGRLWTLPGALGGSRPDP